MKAQHLQAAATPDELRILRQALNTYAGTLLQLENEGLPLTAEQVQAASTAQDLAEECRTASASPSWAFQEADEEGLRRKAHAEHREIHWCPCGHKGQALPLSACRPVTSGHPERREFAYASGVSCDECGRDWSKARALYGPPPSDARGPFVGPVSAYECYAS